MQRFFSIAVLILATISHTVEAAVSNPIDDADKLIQQGLHKDALDKLRPWMLDPNSTGHSDRGVDMVVACLNQLNRTAEIDDFLEQVIAVHKDSWRASISVARTYSAIDPTGFIIDGKFQRGPHRGGGKWVDGTERDRVRALQIMLDALPLVQKEERKTDAGRYYMELVERLMSNRQHHAAWKLQSLTDLATLPDYEENPYWRGEASRAPVDTEGNPVFYSVPESFESAKNDGERWRWALEQAVICDQENLVTVLRQRALFNQLQFGEQTLQSFDFFRSRNEAGPERQASIWSLEALGDNETIANLATGIKRFELPDEFNYIELYKKLAQLHKGGDWKKSGLTELAGIAQNRRQFAKAASYWEQLLEDFPNAAGDSRKMWEANLDQIVKNWGRFEPTQSKAAGTDAELQYAFRNGKKVNLTATEINVEKLLNDIKAYLKSKPQRPDWQRTQIEEIGYRLIVGENRNEIRQKYLGGEVAKWAVDLEPAEKHFDRMTTISVPIKKAGAYLVKAEMQDGNTEYVVLWLNDTAIVQKQLDNANLYFVADAATGKPIPEQKIDLFGYRMQWRSQPRPNNHQQQENVPEWTFSEFSTQTDADGLAILEQKESLQNLSWLATVKSADGRFAHIGFNNIWFGRRYDAEYNQVKTFFISDRPVYRPLDKVEFKVWIGTAKYDQPNASEWANREISYEIHDPRGEKIVEKQNVKLDAYGGFVDTLELPKDATLGVYQVNVQHRGGGSFRVEEYRKPEYEVSVDAPKEPVALGGKIKAVIRAKYYFGSPVTEATVKYKVLREKADADWYPIRPWDWFYGNGYGWFSYNYDWLPGWSRWGSCRPAPFWFPRRSGPPEVVAEQEVKIGPDGTVEIEIDTSLAKEMFPNDSQRYKITAEVIDQSRRTIVGNGSVLVAKEPFKVHAWVNRGWYEPGQKIEASFQARKLDGKPVAGEGSVKLYRITYQKEPGTERTRAVPGWTHQETEILTQEITFNNEGSTALSLTAADAGQYRISCSLNEQEGGYVFNVFSPGTARVRSVPGSFVFTDIELLPDKAEFAPGENVALRVNAKRNDATVLLFVRPTDGIGTKPQVLRLNGLSQKIDIPVTMRDMPNFFIEAITVADGRVFSETKEIAVPPEQRILNVEVKPSNETYKPGAKAKADLIVTDLAGTPVTGQIVASVYDKSVEYISGGSNVGDIKEFFWKWRRHHSPQSQSNLERSFSNMSDPGKPRMRQLGIFSGMLQGNREFSSFNVGLNRGGGGMGGGMGGMGGGTIMELMPMAAVPATMARSAESADMMVPASMGLDAAPMDASSETELVEPTIRTNFTDTALWIGALETNSDGVAHIELDMPESLTTWKINVWSMAPGTRVGYGNAEVVTRKDLMIRMQTPRFLIEKDQCVFSAIVHNYLATDKNVTVSVEMADDRRQTAEETQALVKFVDENKRTQIVNIPAGGEARVDWLVEAASAGDAVITMKALTDEESDAMQKTLPIYVHGMLKTDSFSAYIAPDADNGTITVAVPEERRTDETTLTVRFTPSLAVSMVDALPYLVDYPYGCTEQTLNRFLPTVIVQKLFSRYSGAGTGEGWAIARKRAGVYDSAEIDEMVRDGVTKLTNMQNADGGWGWFSGHNERSSAHLTALVVHGLKLAQQNDVAVEDNVIQRGVSWLVAYQLNQVKLLKETRKQDRKDHADDVDAFVYMVLSEVAEMNKDRAGQNQSQGWFLDGVKQTVEDSVKEMNEFLWRDRAKLSLYGGAMYGISQTRQFGDWVPVNNDRATACVKIIEQYLVQDDENQTAYLNLGGYNNWRWWAWYGSEFETQAYYLKLLMRTDPKSDIAPKLVKYLLNNRRHATYWNSTRDTAICIEAFAEFLRATGEENPKMTVDVLVDGVIQKTVEFTSENLLSDDGILVLEKEAVPTGDRKIELRKTGTGPLYVNAYLEYFSLEDPIPKSGLDVKVERRVYKLERDESATTQAAGGRGQVVDMKVEKYKREHLAGTPVLSGDLIEVELVIESKNDYESIIIEDFKAAGLEPVDVRSGYTGNELGAYVEFRDERVVFFVYRLMRGKHSVTYRLRAETPGTFSALPARIAAMYAPELKGNSDENKVFVTE